MSINSRLVTFAQQDLVLSHNDTERERINASIRQLEKILTDKLGGNILQFIKFGSFTRNTILPREYDSQSDVDVMILFDTSKTKYSPGTYRRWIHDVIAAAYPYSISKKDAPAIKLILNHIMFDLVPAILEQGWYGTYYNIPGSGDNWRQTVPNDINQLVSDRNQAYGNNIIRNVIRLCKHWNAGARYPKESYLMEKEISELFFLGTDDTYGTFLKTMNSIAGDRAGVRQALDYIHSYKGNGWNTYPNEVKQYEWLQKLLPRLR